MKDYQIIIRKIPSELKINIYSYLYFSDGLDKKVRKINSAITHYRIHYLDYLYSKYNSHTISYFVLKYFLYDEEKSENLCLNYNILAECSQKQHNELVRIFNDVRFIDLMRILKYIDSAGNSSELYID